MIRIRHFLKSYRWKSKLKSEKLLSKKQAKKRIDFNFPSLTLHKKGKRNASNTDLWKSTYNQVLPKEKKKELSDNPKRPEEDCG